MSNLAVVQFAEKFKSKIETQIYQESNKMSPKDFTRNRKIGFTGIFTLILQSTKRGLSAGISTFLSEYNTSCQSYTNAAFCKARQKINPEAYKDITQFAAKEFYELCSAKTYRDYRIFAIDGSDLNLPNTPELAEYFGEQKFKNGAQSQVQALLSTMYDVLNHVVVDCSVSCMLGNERTLAMEHLEAFESIKSGKDIITADRGYPSEQFLETLEEKGLFYVIRCNSKQFWREVRERGSGEDVIITRKLSSGKKLKVRVITIKLNSGIEEVFLTNLFNEDYKVEFFKEIYKLRWKIESNYNLLKNNMQIENFSGLKPICILQDIYAQLFLMNVAAMLEADASEDIKKLNSRKNRVRQVMVNRAECIRLLKDNVIQLLIYSSSRERDRLLKRIKKIMLQNATTVKYKAPMPRIVKHPAVKFNNNYRAI